MELRHFSDEEFKKRVDAGEFLERAHVHGHCYGALKSEVDRLIFWVSHCSGVAFRVDLWFYNIPTPFSLIPSFEELELRLRGRGTERRNISTRLFLMSREME